MVAAPEWIFKHVGAVKYLDSEQIGLATVLVGATMATLTLPIEGLLDVLPRDLSGRMRWRWVCRGFAGYRLFWSLGSILRLLGRVFLRRGGVLFRRY